PDRPRLVSRLRDGTASSLDLLLGGRRPGVDRDIDLDGDLAGAEHLDELARAHRALVHEVGHRDGATLREQRAQLVEVDDLVLRAERVREPAQLREAHVERHLPALEAGLDLVAGLRALGTASRRLAALAALTATDADLRRLGARRG